MLLQLQLHVYELLLNSGPYVHAILTFEIMCLSV